MLAELADQLAAEVPLLEVVLDDREDALLREGAGALLPGALLVAEEAVEVEDLVDAGGRGHAVGPFSEVGSQSAPACSSRRGGGVR